MKERKGHDSKLSQTSFTIQNLNCFVVMGLTFYLNVWIRMARGLFTWERVFMCSSRVTHANKMWTSDNLLLRIERIFSWGFLLEWTVWMRLKWWGIERMGVGDWECDVKRGRWEKHEVTRGKCMDYEGGHTRDIGFV
jgi:hypothetical protein